MVDGWQKLYLATSETRRPTLNIPIAPDCSCADKRGMNNKAIKLKLLCYSLFMYTYKLRVK